jgi:hypothetical protein
MIDLEQAWQRAPIFAQNHGIRHASVGAQSAVFSAPFR